jgi:hypothetical protein
MKKLLVTLAVVMAAGFCRGEEDDDWAVYKAKEYGFQMLMPAGTKMVEREKSGGWGGLHAKIEGIEVYALCKLGEFAEKEEARKFAEKESGIAAEHWKKVDEGKNQKGWTWYETYQAVQGDTVIYGAIGTGPKGSYCIFIKTTKADFEEHKADYKEWYDSVTLTAKE